MKWRPLREPEVDPTDVVSDGDVVLVLHIGSLGDTVISLPCFRQIARRHPGARIYLLSNIAVGSKVVPAEAILAPTGVIAGNVLYPMPLRGLRAMIRLRREIVSLRPRVLYYLLPETSFLRLLRHYAFFKLCGIGRIRGVPWSRDQRLSREVVPGRLWESEATRLLRCIGAPPGAPSDADRDLALTAKEHARAEALLSGWPGAAGFIAVSVGGKIPVKEWGDVNWRMVLTELSRRMHGLGAVFVGSADESARNDELAQAWAGPSLNVCGLLAPRETAALIQRAGAFLGHDTGTLHLAGAVGTPIVGIYSARNLPGKWFSDRPRDRFFYHPMPCMGCELMRAEECQHEVACMKAHDKSEVVKAIEAILDEGRVSNSVRDSAPS